MAQGYDPFKKFRIRDDIHYVVVDRNSVDKFKEEMGYDFITEGTKKVKHRDNYLMGKDIKKVKREREERERQRQEMIKQIDNPSRKELYSQTNIQENFNARR